MARGEIFFVIQVSTHLFGSTEGYQTLFKSSDVSEIEERALSIFGFGSPKSKEEIDQLTQHPSVAARLLPSGRFAITRLFPGEADVAGRDTVERRTIIFSAHDWKFIVRCDIESLLKDENTFHRSMFESSKAHSVQVNDSEDLLPCAGELERRLYDILLSTPRQNACALVADDPVNRQGLFKLLKVLPIQEACQLSWGLGLFAATPGVRIATADSSVAAGAHARWASLSGHLAHPEKVALLGMSDVAQVLTSKVGLKHDKQPRNISLRDKAIQYLPWILSACVILALALALAVYKSIAIAKTTQQQALSPPPQIPTAKHSNSETLTTTQAPIIQEKAIPLIDAVITQPAPPETVHPTTPEPVAMPASAPTPAPVATPAANLNPQEPVNAINDDLNYWKQARDIRISMQHSSSMVLNSEALKSYLDQANTLVDLQAKLKTNMDDLTPKKSDFLNLNSSAELSPAADQAKDVCRACILILVQCEIIAAKSEINKQLSVPNKNMTAEEKKTNSHLDDVLKKIKMPECMSKWITPKNQPNKEIPNEILQQWLDPKLRILFKSTFSDSAVSLPPQ